MPSISTGGFGAVDQIVQNQNEQQAPNNALDKNAFLQLLVAQMKYQDPLEPASNTEFIAQLASFSTLEEMQNLNQTVSQSEATGLVGKQVIMRSVHPMTGVTTFASGKVDFVLRENGRIFLSINDVLHPIEDLDTVVDEDYLDAVTLASTFEKLMQTLPNRNMVTLSDRSDIAAARVAFDSMTSYQQNFVGRQWVERLEELEARIKEIEGATRPEPENSETE